MLLNKIHHICICNIVANSKFTPMTAIQGNQLVKSFDGKLALNHLDLNIQEGEVFCLLGQNGAGKTTTINILMGFTTPDSGEALIMGHPPGKGPRISYIPEVVQLYPLLSGLENLDFFSRLAGTKLPKSELGAKLKEAGLPHDVHNKRIGTYSKGMRQKVGIAIALATGAKVILMDEPTSGLDPVAAAEFTTLIKGLAASGHTILMATHDLFNAVQTGTHIGIMKAGRLVHSLPVADVDAGSLQQLYLETV
jgi:ABC-2 type transport system ATP-binding protein